MMWDEVLESLMLFIPSSLTQSQGCQKNCANKVERAAGVHWLLWVHCWVHKPGWAARRLALICVGVGCWVARAPGAPHATAGAG